MGPPSRDIMTNRNVSCWASYMSHVNSDACKMHPQGAAVSLHLLVTYFDVA